jgi:hypothetical protein
LKHWRSHLKRMIETYTGYYGQPLTALSTEIQQEYAKELAPPAVEQVAPVTTSITTPVDTPVITPAKPGRKKRGKK